VYRLIQEGLTNVYKHAGASQVGVTLQRDEARAAGVDELRLTVADDGRGMEPNAHVSRFGLSGMRERVEMAGGTFSLESAPGHGLKFEARLPAHESCNG
jgi:two-component system sensor histidine kinase UhpB